MSVMVGVVAAEIPDGDGTNGIDRNGNTPSEKDGANIVRNVDSTNGLSGETVNLLKNFRQGQNTAGAAYDPMTSSMEATISGTNDDDVSIEQSQLSPSNGYSPTKVVMDNLAAPGFGTTITLQDRSDLIYVDGGTDQGAVGDTITMTLQNWYASIDRSSAHGVGSATGGSAIAGCATVASTDNVVLCSMNGDGALDAALPTQVLVRASPTQVEGSYAIVATDASKDLFFGIDYAVNHNVSVQINGVVEEIGNTKAVNTLDEVHLVCSDSGCDNKPISIQIPGAYKSTNIEALGGDPSLAQDVYNVSARISITDAKTVKLTFGIASEHKSNLTATDGVIYDPTVSFVGEEAKVRYGQIEDGGSSWCDAKWFLAKCDDEIVLDGKAADGVDGFIMHYEVPLEVMYSQGSWGGYEDAKIMISHFAKNPTARCFNGQVDVYVIPGKDIETFRSKNNILQYALTGDYYTMSEPTSQFSAGSKTLGTSSNDYCYGNNPGEVLEIDLGRIQLMTGPNTPYTEYLNGFYDIQDMMYEFYVVVSVKESATPASSNAFSYGTGEVVGNSGNVQGVGIELSNGDTTRDPLQDQPNLNIARSTNSTNQTAPAFASPYSVFYSGITPSDNVIAGRNTTTEDFGDRYMGTQTLNNEVRRDYGVDWSNNDPAGNVGSIGYPVANNTPYSTIECGLASLAGNMKSATIDIFTSASTADYYGKGVNGSLYAPESTWQPYGTLSTNSSRWIAEGPTSGAGVGTPKWVVDNDESNTDGSPVVSFTGVFINGDAYKATCSFVYESFDIFANNFTTTTVTYDVFFTASFDGNYVGSSGGDVDEDDGDSWLDDLDGYDYIIIGVAVVLIGLGLYMWSSGSAISSWFDERLAMMLLGVAILHAWVAAFFGPDGTGDLSEDWAVAIGTLGYLVMALSAFLWGNSANGQGEKNFRFALGGLFLIVLGVPAALTGLLNVESEFLQDAMWTFPGYEPIFGLGAFLGIILLGSSFSGLYRRDGM